MLIFDICVLENPEQERRKNWVEVIFENLIAENFPKLMKDIKSDTRSPMNAIQGTWDGKKITSKQQ